jgi:hypothetical protein
MTSTPLAGSRIKAANTPDPYMQQAPSTGGITVSGTAPTTVPGCSITITTAQANASVMVIGVFDMNTVTTGNTAVGQCQIDGTTQAGEAIHALTTVNARETVSQVWVATLATAGSHTIALYGALAAAGGSCSISSPHTTLTVTVYDW